MQLALHESAYFTEGRLLEAVPNPFVAKDKITESDFSRRIARNQILVRSAPFVARTFTATGASMLAYSVAMPTETTVMYSLLTRKTAKTTYVKDPYDGKWKTSYQMSSEHAKRGGYKMQYRSTALGAHARFAAKNPPIGVKTTVTNPGKVVAKQTTRTAGASLIVGGRLVPILAYGYVGYSVIAGDEYEHHPNIYGVPISEEGMKDLRRDMGTIDIIPSREGISQIAESTVLSGIAVRAAAQVGIGLLTGIFS